MKIGDIGADQQGRVEGNNREAAATEFFDGLSKMNVLILVNSSLWHCFSSPRHWQSGLVTCKQMQICFAKL